MEHIDDEEFIKLSKDALEDLRQLVLKHQLVIHSRVLACCLLGSTVAFYADNCSRWAGALREDLEISIQDAERQINERNKKN